MDMDGAAVRDFYYGPSSKNDFANSQTGFSLNDPRDNGGFGLYWPGKEAMLAELARVPAGRLEHLERPPLTGGAAPHRIIEGDNLAVLHHLQPELRGQVKMIYIDPPYNTGRGFLYPDNYRHSVAAYLALAGDIGENDDSGRLHARWLNMMYPRLLLARELLRDDGVLFVSIDDHEVHTLRLILDEIFGPDNFVATFPWQSRTSRQNDTDLSVQHEYILAYARTRRRQQRRLTASNQEVWDRLPGFAVRPGPLIDDRYSNPDDDPRGPWKLDPFDAPNRRPGLTYTITNPNTGETFWPPEGRCWRTGEERFKELNGQKRILFGRRGRGRPQLKVFLREKAPFGEVPVTWLDGHHYGTARSGTQELQALFGGQAPFSYPKPTRLIRFLLEIATGPRDLVLDFFAGSGTTGQAVLELNRDQRSRRRFVLVQGSEPTGDTRWPTIAELTRERVRRVLERDALVNQGFRALRWVPRGR